MKMAPVTIIVGVLLIALGAGGYGYALTTDHPSPTALIPAGFGLVLLILGVLARQEKMRMHAMHGAVLIGLIGFAMPGYMAVKALLSGPLDRPVAVALQGAMAVICLVFVALCVKSFIDARRACKQQQGM